MKSVFADTAYYLALLTPGDQYHVAAASRSLGVTARVVVTGFVLLEVGNTLSGSRTRAAFPELVRELSNDPNTEVVPLSQELFEKGLSLYARRMDKAWSVTDCISFIVMEERGITEALTADAHFTQAGFRALLREDPPDSP